MHVDGFRFDLASVLSRDEDGQPLSDPPIIWDIETDPVLAGTKLIAEAWDAGGLYQVGTFAGDRWVRVERPVPRRRPRVRQGRAGQGSGPSPNASSAAPTSTATCDREPQKTINFVTCHDGFTLNDVVSYDRKHNEANGEDNRDGNDHNLSWNCGVEGPTDDPAIEALRAARSRTSSRRAAVGRRADADDGRRGPADAARQQQRLLPGRADQLVRLDGRAQRRTSCASPRA